MIIILTKAEEAKYRSYHEGFEISSTTFSIITHN